MEETPEVQEDLGSGGKFKNWLQDNIRIILSVLIVVAIAAGIYSYSKRAEETIGTEEIAMEEIEEQEAEEAVTIIGEDGEEAQEGQEVAEGQTLQEPTGDGEQAQQPTETPQVITQSETEQKDDVRVDEASQASQTSVSEETDSAFIQTAVAGDSVTTLSRKALRNFLEKSNDSSLNSEHKIYIEDYLRKKIGHSGGLRVNEQLTFSKTLIEEAIGQAKSLNNNQLENLKQYSSRVRSI